ncbi:MAG: hypothetical protein ABJA34_01280 [Pseudonocardiales bacterium]
MTVTSVAPAPTTAPADTGRTRVRGTPTALCLVLLTCLVCLAGPHGLGTLASPVFLATALGLGGYFLYRRHWADYLEFTLWLWLLDPLVRRVADYSSHFHRVSLILLAAPLLSLACLPWVPQWRVPVYRDVLVAMAVAASVFCYGIGTGVLYVGVSAAADAGVNLLGPVALGLFLLTAPIDPGALRACFSRVALLGGLILGAYGMVQFFLLPPWDAQWAIDSGITAVGAIVPESLRVFGTLNSPGPYALALVSLILLGVAARGYSIVLRTASVGVALIGLGLSLVRSGWIALAVALMLLLFARRVSRIGLLAGVLAVVAGLALLGGPIAATVSNRFHSSVSAGSNDYSLQQRIAFQTSIIGPSLTDPFGRGLGSTGTASRLAAAAPSATLVGSFDSGVFEALFTLGSIPGLFLLGTTILAVTRAWRRALRRPAYLAFIASASVALAVTLLFTNVYLGIYGVLLWTTLGYSGRDRCVEQP